MVPPAELPGALLLARETKGSGATAVWLLETPERISGACSVVGLLELSPEAEVAGWASPREDVVGTTVGSGGNKRTDILAA